MALLKQTRLSQYHPNNPTTNIIHNVFTMMMQIIAPTQVVNTTFTQSNKTNIEYIKIDAINH